jgi:hypothetical protein
VKLVGAPRRPAQLFLDLLEGGRVDEVAELLLAESSFSRSRSSASAWARRSASGVSSSYMYVAT